MNMRSSVVREKGFWLPVVVGLLYCSPVLFFGKTFFFRDLYLHFFFRKQLLSEFLRNGQVPLWNEFLHGGRPYWGDLSNALLHPSNLLYAVLPTTTAFNLIIIFHFLLMGAAMYALARGLGVSPSASALAGVVGELCGYTLSLGNMLGFLLALPYLPLMLLGWQRFWLTGRRRWLLAALACGVIQVLAGAPELCVLSQILLFGWTLTFPYPNSSRFRRTVAFLAFNVFVLGMTAIQLVPTVEMINVSSRGAGLPYESAAQWSLHPKRLAEVVFPGVSGYVDQFPWDLHYWGKRLVDRQAPYVISLYVGSVTLLLAGLALAEPRSRPSDGRAESGRTLKRPAARAIDVGFPVAARRMLALVAAGSLALAFGRFLPGFEFLYRYVPLIGLFRYPVKFLMAAIVPVALLAAYGADTWLTREGAARLPRFAVPAAVALALAFIGLAAVFRFSDPIALAMLAGWFGDVDATVARRDLNQTVAHAAAIWTIFTILLILIRRSVQRRNFQAWHRWAVLGLVTCDLLLAGLRVNPYAPGDFFSAVPEAVPIIERLRGSGRLYRTKNPDTVKFPALPTADIFRGDRWNLESLNSALAAIYGIPLVFHVDYDRLGHHAVTLLDTMLDRLPWERRLPILSAANVTTIVTHERLNLPNLAMLGELPNRSAVPLYVYRNSAAAGRARIVTHWQHAASNRDALNALVAPGYDPRWRVIVQDAFTDSWVAALFNKPEQAEASIQIVSRPVEAAMIEGSGCREADVSEIRWTLMRQDVETVSACDGYLVFAAPHYPGWRVSIDGAPADIIRADYAFSAVFLPAGKHRVERRYAPVSVIVGGAMSAVFCGIVLVAVSTQRFSRYVASRPVIKFRRH